MTGLNGVVSKGLMSLQVQGFCYPSLSALLAAWQCISQVLCMQHPLHPPCPIAVNPHHVPQIWLPWRTRSHQGYSHQVCACLGGL